MNCPIYTNTEKAAVAQKALEWEEAGYSVDMFREQDDDNNQWWTVIGFPVHTRLARRGGQEKIFSCLLRTCGRRGDTTRT